MSQRINPIGPTDRGAMPVQRIERRKRTPEEHEADEGHEAFDEQLERELRERGANRPPVEEPAVQVDLSTEAVVAATPDHAATPDLRRGQAASQDEAAGSGFAASRNPYSAEPGKDAHIDISV